MSRQQLNPFTAGLLRCYGLVLLLFFVAVAIHGFPIIGSPRNYHELFYNFFFLLTIR